MKFQYRMAEPDNLKTEKVTAFLWKLLTAWIMKNRSHSISSQQLDQVNYGTQPDEMVRSFEDYDWEQGRMIQYCRNDKGGTDRL